ncbi:saccharopine dehydrogenase family protein [Mesorhizobium sp. L-8-3]|uniref:saccharopine dehydrogenase family protein n=1 Tax=Mesorhizobium sp. L-8-3 TaxID=2744522 RepID=UPI001926F5DC|nr:saccharopine dehydrogenase NADP-binding domain-containing protein [Mesorhizobium sp. L-8-3]BCH22007.1 saccharopine dehydrogenase [Mesorhizobium sp. L-8-3]
MTVRLPVASNQHQAVAVFGAAGHTGRFVVAELLRRGITPIAVARSVAKLAEFGFEERGIEVRGASAEDPDSLDRAFRGAAAVINCAGPFLDTADAVASAAIRMGIHYLDVTAEQPSARATFETFDKAARNAGVLVIPAMGFYGGFADLLVTTAMGDWDFADEIMVGIALDRWHPTQGTRVTGEKNTARRMIVANGQLSPVPLPAAEMDWDFPEPFARQAVVELPFSEIVVIARHTRSSELHTYLNRTALRDIRDTTTPPPEPADDEGRSAQVFLVEAIVRNGVHSRRIAAQGRDIYAFSAPLICEAVQRILDGRARGSGAQAPGAVFDARDFLDALPLEHLSFVLSDDEHRTASPLSRP